MRKKLIRSISICISVLAVLILLFFLAKQHGYMQIFLNYFENCPHKEIPIKFQGIAKKTGCDVCAFILALEKERFANDFIKESLGNIRIKNIKEIPFRDNLTDLKSMDGFRLHVNANDPNTETLWFKGFGGSLSCQKDIFFKINSEGKYEQMSYDDMGKLFGGCLEGDCCMGSGQDFFQFGKKLYSYYYDNEASNHITIKEITKNKAIKICELHISHSKIKNIVSKCTEDKPCKQIENKIRANSSSLLSGTQSLFFEYRKPVDFNGYEFEQQDEVKNEDFSCYDIDFNNDGLKDLVCIREWPTRFIGKIHFFIKQQNNKYTELTNENAGPFFKKHLHDSFGFNINVLFVKVDEYVYVIDFITDVKKNPPTSSLNVYLFKNNAIHEVGSMSVDFETEVKLMKK